MDLSTKYFFYDQKIAETSFWIDPLLNTGISFSLPLPREFVVACTIMAIGLFVYFYYYKKTFTRPVFLLLMIGTLGNFYDRLFYEGVRDFLVFPNWFVYNIADVCLTIAIVMMCYYTLTHEDNS